MNNKLDPKKCLKQHAAHEKAAEAEIIIQLIKDYMDEYNKKEHPFLLFDLAHVNENDHTSVLKGVLEFKNYVFLSSFLQMIGAPAISKVEIPPTNQRKAIGNKGTGLIDLYFEYKSGVSDATEKVIIENKINDAGDSKRQLARYIATAIQPKMTPNNFEDIWEKWNNEENEESFFLEKNFSNIHVVYLTSDGSKKPEEGSLSKYFGKYTDGNLDEVKHINYYPINYIENILPWLENDVLPNMPYSDDGIAIAGIRQYVASLKAKFCGKGDSYVISGFVDKNMKCKTDKEKYEKLMSVMSIIKSLTEKNQEDSENDENKKIKSKFKEDGIDVEDLQLQPMLRDLRAAATNIFSKDGSDLGGDWKLYFTPSFIFLYKQKWADLDTRKYSIPSIYFMTSTNNFLNANSDDDNVVKWKLQVDHLDYRKGEDNKKDPFSIGNHNKTAFYEIPSFKIGFDVNKPKSRKDYYGRVLKELESYISLLDNVVDDVNKESDDEIFQEYVLEQLAEKIKDPCAE